MTSQESQTPMISLYYAFFGDVQVNKGIVRMRIKPKQIQPFLIHVLFHITHVLI
jgi:hypothetical protein